MTLLEMLPGMDAGIALGGIVPSSAPGGVPVRPETALFAFTLSVKEA